MTMRGYTLLEMLLVVFIIGLLGSLVAPRVIGRTDDAREAKARADMHRIAQGLNLYRLDAGAYPLAAQGLAALVERPTTSPVPPAWNPDGYLDDLPIDPWGNAYLYVRTDEHHFRLRTLGADGRPGGTGAAADIDHGVP